jgi:uracil-DNA glycosylase
MTMDRSQIDDAIATLAQELRGVVEIAKLGGVEHLPRPVFLAPPTAPPAVTTSAAQAPAIAAPSAAAPAIARSPLAIVPPAPGEGAAPAIAALLASSAPAAERLGTLQNEIIGACTRCKLHRGRSKLVFGVGNPTAELVFVGEGPGADEDRQGVPFVGRAGVLLTKMIEAMKLSRDDVYICNVVKCRPPNNRDPEPDEVEACEGFLQAQLAIVKPKVIVALGRYAAQTLLRTKTPITRLRGTWQSYDLFGEPVALMPTYHPSFLLREETDPKKTRKREAWSDLQQVMKRLDPAQG